MRLFIAIAFSAAERRRIAAVQQMLRDSSLCGRFTTEENLHLTLAFLGETNERGRQLCQQAMDSIHLPEFRFSLDHTGRFGPALYWIGGKPCPPLERLNRHLWNELESRGFPRSEQRFLSHVTLARQAQFPENFDPRALAFEPIEIHARSLTLFHSHRAQNRLLYTPLYETALH